MNRVSTLLSDLFLEVRSLRSKPSLPSSSRTYPLRSYIPTLSYSFSRRLHPIESSAPPLFHSSFLLPTKLTLEPSIPFYSSVINRSVFSVFSSKICVSPYSSPSTQVPVFVDVSMGVGRDILPSPGDSGLWSSTGPL